MRSRSVVLLTFAIFVCVASSGAQTTPDVFAVVAEYDRITATPLWPSFEPQKIPIEIYDGKQTWLFRHPHPPQPFTESPQHKGVFVVLGRDASLTSNTNVDVSGTQTAGVMIEGSKSVGDAAALIAHEAFHVFQHERYPKWVANEAELFIYPVDDPGLLQRRYMETEALRRALLAHDTTETACWTAEALRVRNSRLAGMPPSAVAYERNTELNEGLANYIQLKAAETVTSFSLPTSGFFPEAVRQSAYHIGSAWALLLDRLAPGWQREMITAKSLDELLASKSYFASTACEYTDTEQASMLARAQSQIRGLKEKRAKLKSDFLAAKGWQLVISTDPKTPLNPQGFDPLNVIVVGPGAVLHQRFLNVANDEGALEIMGRVSLTQAAGEHPLFNGIRQLTVTGLEAAPAVTQSSDGIHISSPGVQGSFKHGTVRKTGQTITIELGQKAQTGSGN